MEEGKHFLAVLCAQGAPCPQGWQIVGPPQLAYTLAEEMALPFIVESCEGISSSKGKIQCSFYVETGTTKSNVLSTSVDVMVGGGIDAETLGPFASFKALVNLGWNWGTTTEESQSNTAGLRAEFPVGENETQAQWVGHWFLVSATIWTQSITECWSDRQPECTETEPHRYAEGTATYLGPDVMEDPRLKDLLFKHDTSEPTPRFMGSPGQKVEHYYTQSITVSKAKESSNSQKVSVEGKIAIYKGEAALERIADEVITNGASTAVSFNVAYENDTKETVGLFRMIVGQMVQDNHSLGISLRSEKGD